jgi:serine/threonine protein kinase
VAASDDRTTYCGTLDYMAPEILKAINYSNKVDIWSLGVILFELLQGQTPFKARTPAERIQKITEKNLQFLVGVSTAAKAIIGKMLRNDPRERPSVEEILADEWILRYTAESPRAHGRRVSVFVEDEYEMKLNKHYPPAYHRKNVRTGKIPTVFFNTVKGENDDSGSDNSLYVEENKENKVFSVSTPAEISRKREELEKLQVKLEGKKDRSPSFFSKVFSVFGLV